VYYQGRSFLFDRPFHCGMNPDIRVGSNWGGKMTVAAKAAHYFSSG
jgi:hypothetical protein